MRYEEFDLWIDQQTGDYYPIRVKSGNRDKAEGKLSLADFNQLKELAAKLTADAEETYLAQLGDSLFKALFPDAVGKLYKRAFDRAHADQDTGLRWRLRITPTEVADLPWELIYDPVHKCFLTKSFDTLLTRYVELEKPIRELQLPLPIRILVIVPGRSPATDQERLKVKTALADLGNDVEVHVLDKVATLGNIDRELVANQFHVLHFVGDGAFVGDEPHLLFDDPDGDLCGVSAEQLSYYFESHPSLKIMLLHSTSGGKNSPSLRCVAEKVVQLGAPAAVSLRGKNSERAASIFAQNFYFKLCVGSERGRVDIAVSHARMRLSAELPHTCDFASPILFMRSPKGVVFDIAFSAVKTVDDLHTQRAISYTHNYNLQQHNNEGNTEAALKEKQEQSHVQARISRFYRGVVLSATPRIVLLALVLSLFVFFASHTRLLNAFRVDDYVNGLMRVVAERPVRPLNEDVKIILAEENENGQLGPSTGSHWRGNHTQLINGLSSVGARPKVVVLDLEFDTEAPEFDEKFAGSLQAAKDAGISVVGGKRVDNDGRVARDSEFTKALQSTLGTNWGDVEVGGVLELPLLKKIGLESKVGPYINEYEIARLKTDVSDPEHDPEVEPSIALKAVMELWGGAKSQAKPYFNEIDRVVIVRTANGDQARIPVIRNGTSLEMLMEYAAQKKVHDNTVPYADAYGWATSEKATDKAELEKWFKNSVVLVGYDRTKDRWTVVGEGKRSGVEIHANAVSNILDKVFITPASRTANLLIIVAMFGLGVLLQTHLRKYLPHDVKIGDLPLGNIAGKWVAERTVPLVILCAVIVYVAVAYLVYSFSRISFDMSYHLTALLFGYLFITIIRSRLRPAS